MSAKLEWALEVARFAADVSCYPTVSWAVASPTLLRVSETYVHGSREGLRKLRRREGF